MRACKAAWVSPIFSFLNIVIVMDKMMVIMDILMMVIYIYLKSLCTSLRSSKLV